MDESLRLLPVSQLGEDPLLALVQQARREAGLPELDISDDVAVTAPGPAGRPLVWTADAMVEGVHFRFWPGMTGGALGRRLAAVNVSDLASKGALPRHAMLTLGIPPHARTGDVVDFHVGLERALAEAGASLVGGDTVRAPIWTLSLTLVGDLDPAVSRAPGRSLAQPGWHLYVTGWPGEAAAGLALLEETREIAGSEPEAHLIRRCLAPQPRLAEGQALARALPRLAMMDVSDGILSDAGRMAKASGTRIVIEAGALPISEALIAQGGAEAWKGVLLGGDDYELLFAADAEYEVVAGVLADAGSRLPVHAIGRVEAGEGLTVLDHSGKPMEPKGLRGFEHFSEGGSA